MKSLSKICENLKKKILKNYEKNMNFHEKMMRKHKILSKNHEKSQIFIKK